MKTNKHRKFRLSKNKNSILILMVFAVIAGLLTAGNIMLQSSAAASAKVSAADTLPQVHNTKQSTETPAGGSSSTPASQPNASSPGSSAPPAKPQSAAPASAPKSSQPAAQTPPPAPAPTSDIAPDSACPGESDISTAQTALVCMTAYARNADGAGGISANSQLMSSAASKAQDIINCSFSHTACGRAFDYWFTYYGYACGNRGENIAEGQSTPLEVFTDWMNSSGHRANILNPAYKDEGIASANSSNGTVWVMELGGC